MPIRYIFSKFIVKNLEFIFKNIFLDPQSGQNWFAHVEGQNYFIFVSFKFLLQVKTLQMVNTNVFLLIFWLQAKLSEALRPLKKATLKSDILGFGSNNNLALGKCPIFFINQSPLLHALWQDKKGQAKTEAIYSKRKGGFVDYFSLTEAVCAELESQRCTLAREQILLFFFGREKLCENLQNI